jgi:hypothetical protein
MSGHTVCRPNKKIHPKERTKRKNEKRERKREREKKNYSGHDQINDSEY